MLFNYGEIYVYFVIAIFELYRFPVTSGSIYQIQHQIGGTRLSEKYKPGKELNVN